MTEISGSGGPSPLERKKYEQEYKHGVDLFQRALTEYKKSDNPFQQAEFKSVMDQALNVMNETATELARKELQKHNEKIGKDYAAFQESPQSSLIAEKLGDDLAKAKRSV
jgi:hypothetical protein